MNGKVLMAARVPDEESHEECPGAVRFVVPAQPVAVPEEQEALPV